MKNRLSFRILSLLFAFVLLVTALPLGVYANDTPSVSGAEAESSVETVASDGVSLFPTGYEPEPFFVTEVTDLRTENVKHFDNGDGTYEAVSYGTAVHRKDANGEWQDIDNTLTLREDRGVERYVSSDARISFAPAASGDGAIWSLSENGYSVSLSLSDANLRAGTGADVRNHATRAEQIAAAKKADDREAVLRVDNSTSIVYRNVLSGVDLEYVLSGNDVKETILVQTVCENYDYSFKLSLSGLIPKETEYGAILLCDVENGETVYVIPAPYMTDAKYEYSDAVSYRLTDLGKGEYEIVVSASAEWINDPERAFPVEIDPTVTNQNSSLWDSYTDYSTPTTNYGTSVALWVSNYWITYLQFGLPYLPNGASLNTAYLYVSYYYNITDGSLTANAYQVLGSWNESQITYNNAPQIASTESASATMTASPDVTSSAPGTAIFSIANLVRNWYGAPSTNYGVAIRRASGDNMSVILKSREASAGRAYLSINYYIDAGIEDGIYQIKNAASGKYLTVTGQGTTAGTKLEQRTNSYGDHQQFLVRSIGNYEYTIQPLHATGMALSTQSANTGTNVTLASYNANDNAQVFSISKYDSNNSYVIKTKKSGFNNLFTIPLGLPTNGLKVVQLGFDGLASQRWVFEFAGPENGVYAIQASGTNEYMKSDSTSSNYYISHFTCEEFPLTNPYLNLVFKVGYNSSSQSYIIRNMVDNAVTISPSINYSAPITTRQFGITDDDIDTSMTWNISKATANSYYVWIRTQNDTVWYLALTSHSHIELVSNKNDATKWVFLKYTGSSFKGIYAYNVMDSHVISAGTTIALSDYVSEYSFYSTDAEDLDPGQILSYSVSNVSGTTTSVASITSSGILTTNSGKTGIIRVTVSFFAGVSYFINFYVVSASGEFFLMQNIQNTGGIEIGYAEGNSSGATKTAFPTVPYTLGGSYNDTQIWEKIPSYWDGYYYIRNVGTGLYLSSPEYTTIGAALEMESYVYCDRQAWEFTPTVSGAWKIRSRADAIEGNNLYINIKSETNNTLTQGTYVQNNSYRDEFNIITFGDDVVYNRTFHTWDFIVDPSEEIKDLAKYYDTYTLLHTNIDLDLETAQDLLENSKIMVFNGHGSPTSITIYSNPQRHIKNTQIYQPNNPSGSLDLSNTDIVFFAGCSTGGNACPNCNALNNNSLDPIIDQHYQGCPNANIMMYNLPSSAVEAGAKVAIGWEVTQWYNETNEWIEYFVNLMNSYYNNTNQLYTAKQAFDDTNEQFQSSNASQSRFYGNESFRLSD